MLWLALALAACNPPLPEPVDSDPVDTDPVDTDPDTDPGDTDPVDTDPDTDPGDTDPDTDPGDTDPQLERIFGLSGPVATPRDATNGWNPGEVMGVEVTMTNLTDVDQMAYPGVRLVADHDLVFVIAPSEFNWFGITANASEVATFTVEADTLIPVGTVVNFTASATFMSCTETTDPPCPDPNPISFAVTIQAP